MRDERRLITAFVAQQVEDLHLILDHGQQPQSRVGKVTFLDYAQARAYLPMQREGARLLKELIDRLGEITPLPDGGVRMAAEITPEILDRLAVWGASFEDDEPDTDLEPDDRDLERLRDDLAERREYRAISKTAGVLLDDLRAEAGPLPTLTSRRVQAA